MTTTLAVQNDQTFWSQTQMAALNQMGLANAPQGDLALFFHYAQKTGLDPFSRQIYMISRGGRYTIQSSIDGLRIIAQRSGEYAGQTAPMWCGADGVWKDVWLEPTPPVAAKIGVYRVGFAEPLVAVARLASYLPVGKDGRPGGLWGTMPDVMLAKVAESLALRKAFPNDLSGIYTSEEMDQADSKAAPVVAAPVLDDAQRDALVTAIANADLDQLRGIYKDNSAVMDVPFTNSLGETVTLKSLVVARKADLGA